MFFRTNRPWLPTTNAQSIAVFALAGLLMVNTTVVLLILTGDLPRSRSAEAEPLSVFGAAQETAPAKPDAPAAGAVDRSPQPVGPVTQVLMPAEPEPAAAALQVDKPVASPGHQPPDPDAAPVTFFGVPID